MAPLYTIVSQGVILENFLKLTHFALQIILKVNSMWSNDTIWRYFVHDTIWRYFVHLRFDNGLSDWHYTNTGISSRRQGPYIYYIMYELQQEIM